MYMTQMRSDVSKIMMMMRKNLTVPLACKPSNTRKARLHQKKRELLVIDLRKEEQLLAISVGSEGSARKTSGLRKIKKT